MERITKRAKVMKKAPLKKTKKKSFTANEAKAAKKLAKRARAATLTREDLEVPQSDVHARALADRGDALVEAQVQMAHVQTTQVQMAHVQTTQVQKTQVTPAGADEAPVPVAPAPIAQARVPVERLRKQAALLVRVGDMAEPLEDVGDMAEPLEDVGLDDDVGTIY